MAKQFNFVGRLQLEGPFGLKQITDRIRNSIGNIKANIQIGIDNTLNTRLKAINTSIDQLKANLASVKTDASQTAKSLRQIGSASNNSTKAVKEQVTALTESSTASKKSSTGFKRLADDVEEFGRISGLAVRRFAGFTIATTVIFGFLRTIRSAIGDAIAFERQLVKVGQATGNTLNQLNPLVNEITRLSTELGVSSAELVDVARVLSQAGLSARDTKVALEAIAKTDLSPTFRNVQETTEGAIAAMQQFRLGAKDLEAALGSINAVSAAYAVESEDLIAAIRRTGGVFAAAAGNIGTGQEQLQEFISLFTSVRQTTRESAESIATGLRTIFTRLQRRSTIDQLKELGIELRDLDNNFVGPFEAVRRLNAAFRDLDPRSGLFAAVTEELGGFRQIGKTIPLLQRFDVALEALQIAQEGTSSLTKDVESAQQSLAVQIAKTREQFLGFVRDLTRTDTFKLIAQSVLVFANALITLGKTLKPILPILATFASFKIIKTVLTAIRGFRVGLRGKLIDDEARIEESLKGAPATSLQAVNTNTQAVQASSQIQKAVINKEDSLIKAIQANITALNNNTAALGGKKITSTATKKAKGHFGGLSIAGGGGRIRRASGSNRIEKLPVNIKRKFTGLRDPIKLQAGRKGVGKKGFTPREFGGIFLLPQGVFTQTTGAFPKTEIGGARQEQKISKAIESQFGQKVGFNLTSVSIPNSAGEAFEERIRTSVTRLANAGARRITTRLGAQFQPGVFNEKFLEKINIENVVGNIFEGALLAAGAPYDDQRGGTFDFPTGLGSNLANLYKAPRLANIPVDAKRSFNKENIGSIIGKIRRSLIAENKGLLGQEKAEEVIAAGGITSQITPSDASKIKRFLAGNRVGGGVRSLLDRLGFKDTAVEDAANVFRNLGFAGGGLGFGIPALLEPGELVVGPSAVQSLGINALKAANAGNAGILSGVGDISKVPGSGRGDTFPTTLPDGSFVIRKDVADQISGIFNSVPRFASGGFVSGRSAKQLAAFNKKNTPLPVGLPSLMKSLISGLHREGSVLEPKVREILKSIPQTVGAELETLKGVIRSELLRGRNKDAIVRIVNAFRSSGRKTPPILPRRGFARGGFVGRTRFVQGGGIASGPTLNDFTLSVEKATRSLLELAAIEAAAAKAEKQRLANAAGLLKAQADTKAQLKTQTAIPAISRRQTTDTISPFRAAAQEKAIVRQQIDQQIELERAKQASINTSQLAAKKESQEAIRAEADRRDAIRRRSRLKPVLPPPLPTTGVVQAGRTKKQDEIESLIGIERAALGALTKKEQRQFDAYAAALRSGFTQQQALNFATKTFKDQLQVASVQTKGFGSRLGSLFKGGRLGSQLGIALFAGLPLLQQGIGTETPTKAGIGGGISGGLTGAFLGSQIGSIFGPIGTAFGTVFGGAFGAITSFTNATEEATQAQKEQVRERERLTAAKIAEDFTKNLNEISKAGGPTGFGGSAGGLNDLTRQAIKDLKNLRIESAEIIKEQTDSIFNPADVGRVFGDFFTGFENAAARIGTEGVSRAVKGQTAIREGATKIVEDIGPIGKAIEEFINQVAGRGGDVNKAIQDIQQQFGLSSADILDRIIAQTKGGATALAKGDQALLNEIRKEGQAKIDAAIKTSELVNTIKAAEEAAIAAARNIDLLALSFSRAAQLSEKVAEDIGSENKAKIEGIKAAQEGRIAAISPVNPFARPEVATREELLGGTRFIEQFLGRSELTNVLGQIANTQQAINTQLPKIIQDEAIRSGTEGGGIEDRILDRFTDEFGQVPKQIAESIRANIRKLVGEGSRQQKPLEEILQSPDFINELNKLNNDLLKQASDIVNNINKVRNDFISASSDYVKAQIDAAKSQQEVVSLQHNLEDRIRDLSGLPTSAATIRARTSANVTGLALAGGASSGSIQDILDRIRSATIFGGKIQARLNDPNRANQSLQNIDKLAENNVRLASLREALEAQLKGSQELTGAIEKEIAEVQQRKQAGLGIVELLAGARTDPQAAVELQKRLGAARGLLEGGPIAPGQLQGGLGLLRELSELLEPLKRRNAQAGINARLGGLIGLQDLPAPLGPLLREAIKPAGETEKEKDLINQLREATRIQTEIIAGRADVDLELAKLVKGDTNVILVKQLQSLQSIDNALKLNIPFGQGGLQHGGFVGGAFKGNRDTEIRALQPGEFVVRRNVAQANAGLLEALNNGQLPHFQDGGAVLRAFGSRRTIVSVLNRLRSGQIDEHDADDILKHLNIRGRKDKDYIGLINQLIGDTVLGGNVEAIVDFAFRERIKEAQKQRQANLAFFQKAGKAPNAVAAQEAASRERILIGRGRRSVARSTFFELHNGRARGENVTLDDVRAERRASRQIELLNRRRAFAARRGFASGGMSSDSMLAAVTPGEFVVNKQATQRNRLLLDALNSGKIPAFQTGGIVGRGNTGGGSLGFDRSAVSAMNNLSVALTNLGNLAQVANNLNLAAQQFNKLNIPTRIEVQVAPVQVNVVHNGVEVFAQMEPSIANMVSRQITKALNQSINPVTGETNSRFA